MYLVISFCGCLISSFVEKKRWQDWQTLQTRTRLTTHSTESCHVLVPQVRKYTTCKHIENVVHVRDRFPDEHSCEFGSMKYYAYCGFGGVLSCGLTHTAVVPLDVVKCRVQVDLCVCVCVCVYVCMCDKSLLIDMPPLIHTVYCV